MLTCKPKTDYPKQRNRCIMYKQMQNFIEITDLENLQAKTVSEDGKRMYQFLDKLVSIVMPRIKDFQGVKRTSFDGNGNYNLGVQEQIVFPEIEYGKIEKVRSLQITFVTNTHDSVKAEKLLELLGMPFTKKEDTTNK